MSGNSLWSWHVSAGDNNAGGALFPEGQTRSSLNNGTRQIQAEVRAFANDPGWVQYGDGDGTATIAQASSTSFTVAGVDVTAVYHAGRRIKAQGSSTGTIYGTILEVAFSTNTTVTVDWDDSGALVSEALTIWLSSQPETGIQTPEHGATRPNLLRNGQFAHWGNGTTLTDLADASVTADYCYILSDGNDAADVSKTLTKPAGSPAALEAEVETASKKFGFLFPIAGADAEMLIDGRASLSFRAKKDAGNSTLETIRAALISWSSTVDAYTVDVVSAWNAAGNNPTLIANWTYENTPFSITLRNSFKTYRIQNVAIDTASTNNVAVFIWVDDTDATVDDLLYIADVKVEPGPVATSIPRQSILRRNPGEYWAGTAGGSANAQTLTVEDFSDYEVGQTFKFLPVGTNTGATTLNANGRGAGAVQRGAVALVGGELQQSQPAEVVVTATTPVFRLLSYFDTPLPRGYGDGCIITNGSDAEHDLDIADGSFRSSDNTTNLVLASALTKRFDATWAVGTGNGGMQSGSSLGNNEWVEEYLIIRPDTGVVDVMGVPLGTALVLPTNYTKSQRIGYRRTDGSANFRGVNQYPGGECRFKDPSALDLNVDETVGTTQETHTITAPPNTLAIINVAVLGSDTAAVLFIRPTDVNNVAASISAAPLASAGVATHVTTGVVDISRYFVERQVWVDGSSQIALRATGNVTVRIAPLGWIDPRGRQ